MSSSDTIALRPIRLHLVAFRSVPRRGAIARAAIGILVHRSVDEGEARGANVVGTVPRTASARVRAARLGLHFRPGGDGCRTETPMVTTGIVRHRNLVGSGLWDSPPRILLCTPRSTDRPRRRCASASHTGRISLKKNFSWTVPCEKYCVGPRFLLFPSRRWSHLKLRRGNDTLSDARRSRRVGGGTAPHEPPHRRRRCPR